MRALGANNSKEAQRIFFILSTFNKHDKVQFLAKIKKKIVGRVLKATYSNLNF